MIKVKKKDGGYQEFNPDKITAAAKKSADRVGERLSDKDNEQLVFLVKQEIYPGIPVAEIHKIVERALDQINRKVATAYRDYRNYKNDFVRIMNEVIEKKDQLQYLADRENANADSAFISTKRSLVYKELNKELYKKFFLSNRELEKIRDGYFYIHDIGDRLDTFNCCLFDMEKVLTNGFELAHMKYAEPQRLSTAFAVVADIALSAAAQQYGGFTIPEIDTLLKPYAERSYNQHLQDALNMGVEKSKAKSYAISKLKKEIGQGFQGWEYKFNTLSSSRGDFPFVTVTLGVDKDFFAQMITSGCLSVRAQGQGEKGKERAVLFPKIVFLYDEELHGEGKELEYLFDEAIYCSSRALYPDYLSLSGDGYVSEMYQKYGTVVSPMGCRAYLSPWWKKGGLKPEDEEDTPIFIGRANGGAISLNLPMIYMRSKVNKSDFWKELTEDLEHIRQLHLKTREHLSKMKASINPLAFVEGGLYRGNLRPQDTIAPIVETMTFSFGVTALAELERLATGKRLVEGGEFAMRTLDFINNFVNKAKEKDGVLYAVYGTPAESLSHTQVKQFRRKYGVIEGVSDKDYFTNSFHMPVWEDISPIEKQDLEYEFFHNCTGGHIQYCRYPNGRNLQAIKAVVRRAMKKGYYEGVNIEKNYCDDCGYQFDEESNICAKCGSDNITQINRVCGYIGYSKVAGSSRMNDGKLAEIADRKSM